MFAIAKTRIRGLSMVEILLALGVLGVFLSFASTSLSGAAAKAELRAAVENLQLSVQMAKATARQFESEVVMHLDADPVSNRSSVSFTVSANGSGRLARDLLQDVQLPESITLVSDKKAIRFDRLGVVEKATPVLLVSNRDEDVNQGLLIE